MLQSFYETVLDYRDRMDEDAQKAIALYDAYLGRQSEVSLGIILGEIPYIIPFAILNASLFAMEKLSLASKK